MECGEPPWLDGRKRAKVRCVRTGAGPTAAQRYHAADLGVQFGSQQSKKLKTNNIVSSSSTPVFLPQNNSGTFKTIVFVQTQNTIILNVHGLNNMELWTGKRAWHGDIVMDCRLQRTWTNEYSLCIPQTFELPSSSVSSSDVPVVVGEEPRPTKTWTHITIMGS